MLRLTIVFFAWLASTAHALDDERAMTVARSHCDLGGEDCAAVVPLTNTNVRTNFASHDCADGERRADAGGDSQ